MIVGEAPSKVMRPGDPPLLLARHELAQMAGLQLQDFLSRFTLTNVFDAWPGREGKGDKFPLADARSIVDKRQAEWDAHQVIVLLGRRVAAAFDVDAPWFERRGKFFVAPHPSHVSRWWNDINNRVAARVFWATISSEHFVTKRPEMESPQGLNRSPQST